MSGKIAIIPSIMLHEVYRDGPIVSVTNWAIRHNVYQGHALLVARSLAMQGKVIYRTNGRHPATVLPNPDYQYSPQGLTYQLQLPLGRETSAIRGGNPTTGGRP
jgi:hypothetical protein